MAPKIVETKLEEAVPEQKTTETDVRSSPQEFPPCADLPVQSLTLPHRPKATEEAATQQAASQQVKAELKLAADAAEGPHKIKFVLETGGEPSGQRVKRRYTKRLKRPLFPPYGPTDPDRQGASFRSERTKDAEEMVGKEKDTVGLEDVANVPAAYPRYPDRTYFSDGSRCS